MSEARFTPGPWKFDGGTVYVDRGIQPHIAYLRDGKSYLLTDQAEENGNLIAAAPAMYEALKAVLEDDGLLDLIAAVGEGDPPFMPKVRAALLAAEGKR